MPRKRVKELEARVGALEAQLNRQRLVAAQAHQRATQNDGEINELRSAVWPVFRRGRAAGGPEALEDLMQFLEDLKDRDESDEG